MSKIRFFSTPYPYEEALKDMYEKAKKIKETGTCEEIWLLEHPDLYTKGTSAKEEEFLGVKDLPVYEAGRGGHYTYHGRGQRIGYLMINLRFRRLGVKEFITKIEEWLIATLAEFGIDAGLKPEHIGVWVKDKKIAAIGVRILHGVSMHGFALNVAPDMDNFKGIIPCGIRDFGVTSLEELGIKASMEDIDKALIRNCPFLD